MASWSRQRRFSYAMSVLAVILVVVGGFGYHFLHKTPTCFDSRMNGDEDGVDCGGSCTKLCPSAFLPPSVSWTRFMQVAPNLYNVAAYIVNPNVKAGAKGLPYHIQLLDTEGVDLADYSGTMTLPPGRNTLVFLGALSSPKARMPVRAFFEFTGSPAWYVESDPLSPITVTDKHYSETSTGSALTVTLANSSAEPIDGVTVYVVLKDKDGNAIDFSRTLIDEIPANGSVDAPYTWPRTHAGSVISIEVLPVAE